MVKNDLRNPKKFLMPPKKLVTNRARIWIAGFEYHRATDWDYENKQYLNFLNMFTPEVPKHPACLSIWLESLFEHIDYRVTVVKNDPRNRKKEKNGAPQNWFFSASMSLHLFEWLSLSSSQYYILKGLQS